MKSEIICSLISFAGIVISAVLSRVSASREIKKLKLEWARTDSVSLQDKIADAVGCSVKFAQTGRLRKQDEAVQRLAEVMIMTDGELNELISELYDCVSNDQRSQISQLAKKISKQHISRC